MLLPVLGWVVLLVGSQKALLWLRLAFLGSLELRWFPSLEKRMGFQAANYQVWLKETPHEVSRQ